MKWKERWKFFAIKWWHQRFTNPLPCFVIHMVSNKETQTFSNEVLTSGVSITCVCDPQGAIFNCFPTNYKRRGEVTASSREASVRRAEVDTDERVEIILATTALVAVIAMFLRCKTPDPCCCMSLTFGGWASYPLIFRSMHMSASIAVPGGFLTILYLMNFAVFSFTNWRSILPKMSFKWVSILWKWE